MLPANNDPTAMTNQCICCTALAVAATCSSCPGIACPELQVAARGHTADPSSMVCAWCLCFVQCSQGSPAPCSTQLYDLHYIMLHNSLNKCSLCSCMLLAGVTYWNTKSSLSRQMAPCMQ